MGEMDLTKVTMQIFNKLEQQWLLTNNNNLLTNNNKKTTILSIDGGGGGTSATIALAFVVHLEDTLVSKTGDHTLRIADFFDMIVGTGIGGLLAALLTAADTTTGRPLFTAREVEQFLTANSSEIFKPKKSNIFRRRSSRRCSGKTLGDFLRSIFTINKSPMTLKDTCKPILIPCYDLNTAAPFVFSTSAASAAVDSSHNFELWKVCRAAMATPSVFAPFKLTSTNGKSSCFCIDGGLVMNNPTATAVTHVLHNKVHFPSVNGVEDLMVLSLGNGNGTALSNGVKFKDGEVSAGCLVDVAVDGVNESVDQLMGSYFCYNRSDYVRIQANGLSGSKPPAMDEVLKEKGVESLPFGGKRLLSETNGERIEAFVHRVVAASRKTSLPPSPYEPLSPKLDGR